MIKVTQQKLGNDGAVEIAVRLDGELLAVVTHPFAHAPWWFVHFANGSKARFTRRHTALAAAKGEA